MYTILRKLSLTQRVRRVAVVTTVSLAMFLLAACDSNSPTGQRDLTGPQSLNGLSKTGSASTAVDILRSASTFAVMGAAGVTNTGASLITGDLGVGPAAPAATGFDLINNNIVYAGGTVTTGLGIVNGTIYAGGPVALQAHNDAVLAYNYLAGLTPDTVYSGVTQLHNMTFTPGVYSFAPSANLQANGTMYLDFEGNNDALFVFQTGTTLVTTAGSKVIALNNNNETCSGSNVYWAVGSAATIDGDEFIGTVIANTEAITMTSGAKVFGRVFALTASVTLDTDTISVCGSSGGVFPPKPPKPCRDFVTGGGKLGNKATFGVSGGIKHDKFWGQLSFNDHNGVRVKSRKVTAYIVLDPVTRLIEGTAKVNGKGSFTYKVIVVDNGEPGRNDSFSLEVSNDSGYSYSTSGTLKGGNIQLHRKCGEEKRRGGRGDNEEYDDKEERDGHKNCDRD
jgi:hypothetical protein